MNPPPKFSFACPMPWKEMTGSERSKFCAKCGHHVHNLSLMSAAERAELLRRAQTERVCGSYLLRLSGEMVTPEKPLQPSEWQRVKQFGVAALSAGALALATGCMTPPAQSADKSPTASACQPKDKPSATCEKKEADEEVIQLSGVLFEVTPDTNGDAPAKSKSG